jgi:hypothetical protein
MFQIQSERVLRDTRKQMAAANAGAGIAVLPLYGVVTQRGNMVDDISGPGSTSTQQFTSALRQVLADDTVVTWRERWSEFRRIVNGRRRTARLNRR